MAFETLYPTTLRDGISWLAWIVLIVPTLYVSRPALSTLFDSTMDSPNDCVPRYYANVSIRLHFTLLHVIPVPSWPNLPTCTLFTMPGLVTDTWTSTDATSVTVRLRCPGDLCYYFLTSFQVPLSALPLMHFHLTQAPHTTRSMDSRPTIGNPTSIYSSPHLVTPASSATLTRTPTPRKERSYRMPLRTRL